jgi:protein-L-isoaspartate O-methyltransferase
MLVDATSYVQALTDIADLVEGQGPFVDIIVTTSLNMPPHKWWDLIGAGAHTLAPIAKCILAQVCSTSSCE